MPSPLSFSDRLALRRQRLKTKGRWTDLRSTLHRFRERRALRTRDDPDEVWRCCEHWTRTLLNKWNSREFASRYGCLVPELYWAGASFSKAPLDALPSHFVIRRTSGAGRHQVVVMANGVDVLRDRHLSPAELRRFFRGHQPLGPPVQFLIEEFLKSDAGDYTLPLEYKCHTFGATVGAVQVIARTDAKNGRHRYYSPQWEPFDDPMGLALPQDTPRAPPRHLAQMLAHASALGSALGSYVRIDFFATERGPAFNEFSLMPAGGRKFTPYAEELFARLWRDLDERVIN